MSDMFVHCIEYRQWGTSLIDLTTYTTSMQSGTLSIGFIPPVQSPNKDSEPTIYSLPAKDLEWVHNIQDQEVKKEIVKNISDYIKQAKKDYKEEAIDNNEL